MMTHSEAVAQIARLAALSDSGALTDAVLQELTNIAVERFTDAETLCSAVNDLLSDSRSVKVPTPGQLAALARDARIGSSSGVGCKACGRTGFVVRAVKRRTIDGVRDVSMAYFCACHSGSKKARSA